MEHDRSSWGGETEYRVQSLSSSVFLRADFFSDDMLPVPDAVIQPSA